MPGWGAACYGVLLESTSFALVLFFFSCSCIFFSYNSLLRRVVKKSHLLLWLLVRADTFVSCDSDLNTAVASFGCEFWPHLLTNVVPCTQFALVEMGIWIPQADV